VLVLREDTNPFRRETYASELRNPVGFAGWNVAHPECLDGSEVIRQGADEEACDYPVN
jgi:hypothetical protein